MVKTKSADSEHNEAAYRELKERAPDLYRQAVNLGNSVLCHDPGTNRLTIAATVEQMAVELVLAALEPTPSGCTNTLPGFEPDMILAIDHPIDSPSIMRLSKKR